jgi:acetolactate synthase-1/2/3 large subunit
MTDRPFRAADAIARRLYEAGVRHAFGMPGGEVLTLVDALTRAGIRFILCKHENSAGFMAEAAYHATGAPAVLVATVGPGAVNGVNVVANAQQERVPMIVLTGCVDADEAETYTHQVLDHRAVFGAITKATFTLTAGAADVQADKAVGIACEGRPGPVLIDVPISVADAPVHEARRTRRPAAAGTALSGTDLATARAALEGAERPLALLGVDILTEGCAAEVTAFLDRTGIPAITTYKAKGVLPEDHPLALGGAGLSPLADRHLLPLVAEADVILCLGYDPIEMRTGWRDPWDTDRQTVIDLGHAPNHHYMHQATLNVVGPIAPTLTALAGAMPRASWRDGRPAQVRQALAEAFAPEDDWGPGVAIETCRHLLPPETVATVDSGAHRILLSQMWTCPAPQTLLQSAALCTMGCAVPLAIGTGLVRPEVPSVSFSGDAGFLMVAGELSTAAELGVRTIFVVFVDASLALIEKKQRERQMPNAGVDFGHHDYAAMGRAFGGRGATVRDRAGLEDALRAALEAETFTVIAVEIDARAYDGRI